MPAGTCCLEAARLLAAGRGDTQLRSLIRQFAHTVIYEPPLAESADVSRLGPLVDGVVLVVNESMTTSRLRTVAARLESAGARIVGAVLYTPKNRIFEALDRWF
jgi:Mrp family chromosome partitioning ATPase